jgi:cell fate regulator YaaT (PSP1 superfamily)
MGCSSCSSGRGGLPAGCNNNGACGVGGCSKLPVFDWLSNMDQPAGMPSCNIVEVRFKNSRKEFFKIGDVSGLAVGDAVAVEASPGHDLGMVSMTGELVRLQMKKLSVQDDSSIKAVYRKARPADIEKWQQSVDRENPTMLRARAMATELKLNMKISDVEYQGDGTKAIFYYTSDERVDFRELIRHLADEFRIRVEMRQIGSRQESARLGGIGSCGRELCCSTWLRDFRSVNTSAARYQQLSLNPQKLAGQCGKLKCCLNYELDSYLDAIKDFPESNVKLETLKGNAVHQKTDIFRGVMFYAYFEDLGNFIAVPVGRVKEIIALNKAGEKPEALLGKKDIVEIEKDPDYENVVGQDSLTRFDASKKNKKKKKKKPGNRPEGELSTATAVESRPVQQQRPPQQQQRPQQNPNRPQQPRVQGENKPEANKQQNRPPQPRPQNQSGSAENKPAPQPGNNTNRPQNQQPRPQNQADDNKVGNNPNRNQQRRNRPNRPPQNPNPNSEKKD